MENSKLALTIADKSTDSQLPGVTKGKLLDIAANGMKDQMDWINLPYASKTKPSGTEAWQQLTVESEKVEAAEVTADHAVVKTTGKSLEVPNIQVETIFTIEKDQEWITANTVFTNTGSDTQTFWIGDAIDYDGSGQRSGVGGNPSITLPYSNPQEFTLSEPWIGMTGTDKQVYGLIYAGDTSEFLGYGNGNWIMSQKRIEVPAGESYTLERKILAVNAAQSSNPISVLGDYYQQFKQ